MSFLVHVFFLWVGIYMQWTASLQNHTIIAEGAISNVTVVPNVSQINNTDIVHETSLVLNRSVLVDDIDERSSVAPNCVDVFNSSDTKQDLKNFIVQLWPLPKNLNRTQNVAQCGATQSCSERCNMESDGSLECSCSRECLFYGDCCFDFFELCHNTSVDELEWALTDSELFTQTLSLLNQTIRPADIPDGEWLDVTYMVSCRLPVHQAMSSTHLSDIFQTVDCFHCVSTESRTSDNSEEVSGFKMVSVCPQSWVDVDIKKACENQAPTFNNPPFHDGGFRWVTYRNIHCAQCHGRNIDLLRRWNVSLKCPQIENLEDRIQDAEFLKKYCSFNFSPFPEFRIKPCNALCRSSHSDYKDIKVPCPARVGQLDDNLEENMDKNELLGGKPDLSKNLNNEGLMTYDIKNVYQLWCGLYGHKPNGSPCVCSTKLRPSILNGHGSERGCTGQTCRSPAPLSVLFSVDNSYRIKVDRVETDTEVEIPEAKTCENDQVYSPIDQNCLRVECSAGQRFQYGECAEDTLRLLSSEGNCFAVLLLHVRISLLPHVPHAKRIEAKTLSKILETTFEQYAGDISVESFYSNLMSTKTDSMDNGQEARNYQYCDVHDKIDKSDVDYQSKKSDFDEGHKESKDYPKSNNYEFDQAPHEAEVDFESNPSESDEECKDFPPGDKSLDDHSGSVGVHSEPFLPKPSRRTLFNKFQQGGQCESETFVNVTVKLRSKKWSEMVRVVDVLDILSRESKPLPWVHQNKTVVGCFSSFTLTNFDPSTETDCPDSDVVNYHNFSYITDNNRFVEFDVRGLDKKLSVGRITDRLFLRRTAGWKRQKTVSVCGTANKTDLSNCSLILGFRTNSYIYTDDGGVRLYINNSEYRAEIYQNSTNLLLICSKNLKKIILHEFLYYSRAEIILGYICRSASLVGLVLTLFTYSVFKNLRNVPGKIVICLSVCLLLVTILSLLTGELKGHWLFCPLSAGLLQYFFLCSFCWMNTLALDIALSFRQDARPSDDERSKAVRFRLYCVYAVTLPLLFTVAPIVTEYIRKDWVDWAYLYATQQYCWLHKDFRYFFHVPVLLLLVVNVFLFVRSVKSIRAVSKITKTAKIRSTEKGNALLFLKLFLVMGLSWLFTFVGSYTESAADIVFSLLSSLQGVFIFVTFVCNSRVVRLYKAKLRKMCECNREGSETRTTSMRNIV